MSKRIKDGIPLAIVLVAVVVVGLLSYTTPDPVAARIVQVCPNKNECPSENETHPRPPSEEVCPSETAIQPCPYQDR